MCELNKHNDGRRMDPCIIKDCNRIQRRLYFKVAPATQHLTVVASCCGHGKYPKTIVIENNSNIGKTHYEYYSKVTIPRKRRYYQKDKQGYYFIPELKGLKLQ